MARPPETPLRDVRVLELGSFIAGPFAGQLLGDLGAEVVKVEPPGDGDPMRRWGVCLPPTAGGAPRSVWWPAIARNKRSVAIDLRRPEGAALVASIARSCDVVLENFRPGTLESFGLGYDALAAANPGLVMVHVSGFGRSGPRAAEAGFGSIGEAAGGIRHTTGDPDRLPSRAGVSLGDSLAALFAVIGTLSALHERARSGRGQEVDVAIAESVFALMESTVADYELAGVVRGRSGGVLPGVSPSNAYPTADGDLVVIAANADAVYARLTGAMQRSDLARDPRFADHAARGVNMAELDELIAAWTATLSTDALLERLRAHAVPAGRIQTAADLSRDPQLAARDMVVRLAAGFDRPVAMAGVVPKLTRTPGQVAAVGPELGRHTDEVLRALAGLDDAALDGLHAAGVIEGPRA
ncbi:MAG TPA: CoA transferase [Acidimicrobiia bacterium]